MNKAPFGTTLAVGDLVDFLLQGHSKSRLGRVAIKQHGALSITYVDSDGARKTALYGEQSNLITQALSLSFHSNREQALKMLADVVAEAMPNRDAALMEQQKKCIADLKAQLAAAKQTNAQQQTQHSAQLAVASELEQRVASLDASLRESRAQSKSQEDQISALQSQLQSSELRCKAAEATLQQASDARSAQDQRLNAQKASDDVQQRVAQLESELNRSQAQLKEQCESGFQALEHQLSRVLERLEHTATVSVTEHGSAGEAGSSSAVSSAAADTHTAASTSLNIAGADEQQQSQPEVISDAPLAAEVTSNSAAPPSRSVSAHSDRSSDDEWKVVQTD